MRGKRGWTYTAAEIAGAQLYTSKERRAATASRKETSVWTAKLTFWQGEGEGRVRRSLKTTFPQETAHTAAQAKKAASEWHRRLISEAEAAELEATRRAEAEAMPTIGEYMERVLGALRVEPSTMSGYRVYARRIAARFGEVRLCDLSEDEVARWHREMEREGLSQVSISHAHALLSQVMKFAHEEDELITRNPCKKRVAKPPKRPHKDPNALSAAERGRLLDYLEGARDRRITTAAAIALLTGMRREEICGLRWRDVDLERRTIRVGNAIGMAYGNPYEKAPKTAAGWRTVYMPEMLCERLRARRAAMLAERLALVETTAEEFGRLYVVGGADGTFYNPGTLTRDWRGLASTLELVGTQGKAPTFHDLRHTYAMASITTAGADVRTVSGNLGHSDAAVTLNRYATLDPEAQSGLAERMGDAYAAELGAARAEREAREREEARRGDVVRLRSEAM